MFHKSQAVLRIRRSFNWQVFLMAMAGVLFLFVFAYVPMGGIAIAFKEMDYSLNMIKALKEKPFVGFKNFGIFFKDKQFIDIIFNTLGLNILQLLITFPAPIIFALLLNEIQHNGFTKFIQTITYFPYFISWVVFGGIVLSMISVDGGIINDILVNLHITKERIAFASKPQYFWGIVIISSLIKGLGWGAVIYIAAIVGVDQTIYDSAVIDGANRFQRAVKITIPCIAGTITVMLLLSISGLLNSSFDQIYILQNPLNISRSEVLDTFIYKTGITQRRYSYTTAIGLFKSAVSLILLLTSHLFSKRIMGRGLF
jgi:putative aldouronate transport system permease protein